MNHVLLGLGACGAPAVMLGCNSERRDRSSTTPKSAGAAQPSAARVQTSNFENLGALLPPDANGLRLPSGFSSRVVARAGVPPLPGCGYPWHGAPDGGATFASDDGGWIYVSNSEVPHPGRGGAGALRFDSAGQVVAAYPILRGTTCNCAGGPTPWGTWLSCEEFDLGRVHECDPSGKRPAIVRPALGTFRHEAAAVDAVHQHVYLTEDQPDGKFYRFVPERLTANGSADLAAGRLEVAAAGAGGRVTWRPVPDPGAVRSPTRFQVAEASVFNGGEGAWYHDGKVYFATKGDNRIWAYDVASATLRVVYDARTNATPILTGVDNVTASSKGAVLVAEDGGDMQIVALLPNGEVKAVIQLVGQPWSEITGPALSPSGRQLYFSSQRSDSHDPFGSGLTYEVSGPFLV